MVELVCVARIPGRTVVPESKPNDFRVSGTSQTSFHSPKSPARMALPADWLISKNYEVHGIKRRSSSFTYGASWTADSFRLARARHQFFFSHFADCPTPPALSNCSIDCAGRNLSLWARRATVRVSLSYVSRDTSGDIDALGTTRLLDAIRETGIQTRYYNASSTARCFGQAS